MPAALSDESQTRVNTADQSGFTSPSTAVCWLRRFYSPGTAIGMGESFKTCGTNGAWEPHKSSDAQNALCIYMGNAYQYDSVVLTDSAVLMRYNSKGAWTSHILRCENVTNRIGINNCIMGRLRKSRPVSSLMRPPLLHPVVNTIGQSLTRFSCLLSNGCARLLNNEINGRRRVPCSRR